MNIKKLFIMTFILLIIYVLIQMSFKDLNHGHEIKYEIKTEKKQFNVLEVFTQNYKDEMDNYYFEINYNNTIFNIQTNNIFNKKNYVISDIYYYENNDYKCIYPIFKTENIVVDVMCKNGNDIENYTNIKGKYADIDQFVLTLKKYNPSNFIDSSDSKITNNSIIYYKENNTENNTIALENYKGLYLIKDDIKNIKLFNKDVYTKNISGFIDNYYVVANYNKEFDSNEIYLINLNDGKKTTLTRDKAISLDSIYQGVVNNKLYFIDKSNKIQYEVTKDRINKYGDINSNIKVYKNKKWNEISFRKSTTNEYIMSDYKIDNTFNNIKYEKVDKIGNKFSGYYYLYEKINGEYKVYRVNTRNINIRKYLFTTTNINNVVYKDDVVYYINKDTIYKYSEKSGNKSILKSSELEFNGNIKFEVK